MKKIYMLFFLVLLGMQSNVFAEDINVPGLRIPQLILTEVRPDGASTTYIEITNIGDTAINLDPFTLHSVHFNTRCTDYSDSAISFNRLNEAVDATIGKVYLKGLLAPGESYVVANVWDGDNSRGSGIPNHNIAIAQIGDQFAHINEQFNLNGWIDNPAWQCFGKDSVSAGANIHIRAEETAGYLLHWVYLKDTVNQVMDSTYIDQFNHFWYPDENTANGINIAMKGFNVYPIAGVEDAMTTSVMVRKASVTKGNLDWDQSRGTDAATSEWLVIPKSTSNDRAFTTVGVHGVYDLDYTVKDPSNIILDEGAKTISVPWQMVRGDSLSRYFNLGDGMSWSYEMVGVFDDSASYISRPGDKFSLYAVGNEVDQVEYTVQVREAEPDVALVFPRRQLVYTIEYVYDETGAGFDDTIVHRGWSTGFVYNLSQGPEIDSIINVSFATRKDSLLKYLDKPEKASWEFVFVDGEERVDLKFGDKLKVTSEDGSAVKEYFIAVDDYVQSNNANLSAVTWPDIDKLKYPRWITGDTLPEFTPLKTAYTVELRFDEKKIPAFQFKTADFKASMVVENATDIDGNLDQRTTKVTVTSESDTISKTYSFTFIKQNVPVQPNIAEPFISEMIWNVTTQGCAVEIYNPGTEDLDLSRYMYVAGTTSQTLQEAVETCVSDAQYTSGDGIKIYQTHYVPSKRWAADRSLAEWSAIPDEENPFVGKGFLIDDNQTDPWVEGGDVWVMGVGTSTNEYQTKIRQESDFIFRGSTGDGTVFAWDSTKILHRETPIWNDPRHNMWLLKVLNDSILDGTKDVRDASQYELIDRIEIMGDTIAGRLALGKNWTLIRKPHITKGNLERMGGSKSTPENSEWILMKGTDVGVGNSNMVANIGLHIIDPITNYLSTVTSVKFIVTVGFDGDNLSITGSISDYTPTTIAEHLDKADASQTFAFMRGETELTADQSLADGDVLVVTSGDGKNTTKYTLINSPLDGDTSLSAKAGSGLAVEGDKVTGVTVGMLLKDALANLEVAEKSVLYVLDAAGAYQSLIVHNLDSLVYDVLVGDQLSLQVVAENNDKATYYFDFGLASNEAVLLSNILPIDQDRNLIMEYPEGITAPSLLAMVFTTEGASLKVLDKAGFERTAGLLNIDDVVEVTAADGVTKAIYSFYINYTAPATADITFVVDDSRGKTYTGFDLKGSWNTATGEYDLAWSDGALHASFVDDGTSGDETAGDHIWSITVPLVYDGGANTWEWGFQDDAGNWIPAENQQFTLADETAQTLVYSIVGIDESVLRDVSIYPNPARTVVSVANAEGAMISIIDLDGRVLKVQENAPALCELDLAGLSRGMYLIEIQLDDVLKVAKLIVQ